MSEFVNRLRAWFAARSRAAAQRAIPYPELERCRCEREDFETWAKQLSGEIPTPLPRRPNPFNQEAGQ